MREKGRLDEGEIVVIVVVGVVAVAVEEENQKN